MLRSTWRRRRPLARSLRLQTLEDRTVLAGDVDVFTAGGNLFIFGDRQANQIELTRDGTGQVTVAALDDTTINGQSTDQVFTVTRGIFIYLRGGDDVVRLAASGNGPFFVNGVLHIDTAGGNDEVSLSNVEVRRSLVLLTGAGNDRVLIPDNALTGPDATDVGVIARGVSVIVTGRGADEVGIVNSEFRRLFVLNTAGGNDTVVVRDSEFQRSSVLVTGSGNDTLTNSGNTFARPPVIAGVETTGDVQSPTAVNDAATVAEGAAQTINVSNNDFDPDGSLNPASIVITQQPTNGAVAVNANGTVTYTHNGSETTSDSFQYTIKDASGKTSNAATVAITVTPVNDPPVAVNDTATVNEGAAVIIDVEANDTDAEGKATIDQASIVIVAPPAHGSVQVNNDGTVTYTHNGSETTSDSFTYTIKDSSGATSNTATVAITINPVNDPPVANNDAATVAEGGTQAINVAANDTDPEGNGTLNLGSITIITPPAQGTATANANGTVTYTHNGSETTGDSFTYTIKDASGATSNVATVTITITPVNDPPVAGNDTATVDEGGSVLIDVAANDSDADDGLDLTTLAIVDGPAHGTLIDHGDGTFTYAHDGSETTSDSFTYTILDLSGAISNVATVTITITPVNDDPLGGDDANEVTEDGALIAVGNVLTNDSDPEDDPLSVTTVGSFPLSHGTLELAADGSYTYTLDNTDALVQALNEGESLTDSFVYSLSDGQGGSGTATLTITIHGADEP